ncbi:unnamed protein product [Mucor fragilis]
MGEEEQITIHQHHNEWIVNNTNISKSFHIFRNKCIDMLEGGQVRINYTQKLSKRGLPPRKKLPRDIPELGQLILQSSKDYSTDVLADNFNAAERQNEAWYRSVVNANDKDMKLMITRTVLDL